MKKLKVSVVPGDTLSEIAARYDVSVEALQQWNGIQNRDFVQAGQTIVVYTPMDAPILDLSVGAWIVWMVVAVVILAFLLFLFRQKRSTANSNSPATIDQQAVVSHQFELRRNAPTPAREIQPGPEMNVIDSKSVHRTLDAANPASRAPAVPPAVPSRRDRPNRFPPKFALASRRLRLPKENAGERLVRKQLKRRYRDWTHFNNLLLHSGQGTTQIDHILVSPVGVFVIETKDMNGWLFGSPGQMQWTQTFSARRWSRRLGVRSKRFPFYNPLLQNEGHARALANLGIVERRWIRPIVVFVGDAQLKTANEFLPFDEHEKKAKQNSAWRMRGVICMSLAEMHRYIGFSTNATSSPGLTRQSMEAICAKIRAAEIPMTAESYAKHVNFVQSVKEMASHRP